MSWVILFIAGLLEVAWAVGFSIEKLAGIVGLKLAHG